MKPAPAAAQAAASVSAIISAWSRPSSWQGPAISVSGAAFETASVADPHGPGLGHARLYRARRRAVKPAQGLPARADGSG